MSHRISADSLTTFFVTPDFDTFSMNKLPIFLAVLLYLLIYSIRLQQGGWEPKVELFKELRGILDERIAEVLPSPQS